MDREELGEARIQEERTTTGITEAVSSENRRSMDRWIPTGL
jgi:hypothetical protein